ncbi:MAG: translational GTPase TypA [Bacteroidia bacterium]
MTHPLDSALRNIAIIAHVDHGKTTMVDKIMQFTRLFKPHQEVGELVLDNNDLERERGITIFSKNVSVEYKGVKINIIDTPGHSDFGGEVERVLKMADGVLLLVDAFEGPMPQTRFVLSKALELGLHPIVVINKVDKENCRPDEVHDAVFELFFNLGANEQQLDFPTVYGSSKQGWMGNDWKEVGQDFAPLMDAILTHVPAPLPRPGTLQMQITSLDYSSFVGRIAIGRVHRGAIREGQALLLLTAEGQTKRGKVKELYVFEGLGRRKVERVEAGDLCAVVGLEDFQIGDTLCDVEAPEALPAIKVDEPTLSMLFTINNSPFFGQEGKMVTSRHLRDRLYKETEKNLALRVEDTDSPDSYLVYGRGILHLSILIETMRREGYELQVGQPTVVIRQVDGAKHEPFEQLVVDVPEEFSGKIIEVVTMRRGEMMVMEPKGDWIHLEFELPARALMGLRSQMLTLSQGEAISAHRFLEFRPWKGVIPGRINGSLVSMETGPATAYSLDKLQDRGVFFVESGENLYEGMVVGEHIRPGDLVVNLVKGKQLTNMRAAGKDDNTRIAPPKRFSLEEAMEYIQEDEWIEITPKSMRMRKIHLKEHDRKRKG